MPNRPLTTRYEDDFSLLSGRWERIGIALLVLSLIHISEPTRPY